MSEPRRPRPEWICPECDWIGSPEFEPDCCPNCGHPELNVLRDDAAAEDEE